jgi:hypothetical protein
VISSTNSSISTRRSPSVAAFHVLSTSSCEQPRDVVEVLGHIVTARLVDPGIVGLALRLPDSHGQASLLFGEQVGSDLVVVVQASSLRRWATRSSTP